MTEVDQIIGRLLRGGEIVDRHRIQAIVVEGAAEQHHRRAPALRLPRRGGKRVADRDEDEALAVQHPEASEDALFGVGVLVAVADDERIAPSGDRRFRCADNAAVERVGEVGDDDCDEVASAAAQVARDLRGGEAQFPHGVQYART